MSKNKGKRLRTQKTQRSSKNTVEDRILSRASNWAQILGLLIAVLTVILAVRSNPSNKHPTESPDSTSTAAATFTPRVNSPETRTVAATPTTSAFTLTSTIQPMLQAIATNLFSFTPIPTLTSVSQPTRSNSPLPTNILPTHTNIPPSDTPLPPTQMPSPATTNILLLAFDKLPSAQGWRYLNGTTEIPDTEIYSANGSLLHMNTVGKPPSGYAYLLDYTIDPNLPFTLIVEARVIAYDMPSNDNGFDISVYIGFEQFEIGISPDRIVSGSDSSYRILSSNNISHIDVTQVHKYRIEGQAGQDFKVFVDDILLGIVPPTITNREQYALYFGDATAGANSQVDITSYSFTQGIP